MKYLTVNDVCSLWGVSQQFVRRLCKEGRIPGAEQTDDGWLIPEGTEKPGRKPRTQTTRKAPQPKTVLTPFAKRIVYQRTKNNHYGVYEYIQVNLTYSSNRMASNRLTRNEVEEVYRTNKISTSFEPVKVDDIIETSTHFRCIDEIIKKAVEKIMYTFSLRCAIIQVLCAGWADPGKEVTIEEFSRHFSSGTAIRGRKGRQAVACFCCALFAHI